MNEETDRVICELENAGETIDGIRFVRVTAGTSTVHCSERIPRPVAARLCRVTGFRMATPEILAECEAAIEQALSRSPHAATSPPPTPDREADIAALIRANEALAADVHRLREENERLRREKPGQRAEELETLRLENSRLKQELATLHATRSAPKRGASAAREIPASA